MSVITINPRTRHPGPGPVGRRCSHPDCITILNRWHAGEHCYLHEQRINGTPSRGDTADLLTELMQAA